MQPESLLSQYLPVVLLPCTTVKTMGLSSWWPPHMYWGTSRLLITSQSCFFTQTEQAPNLHPLLTGHMQPHTQSLTVLVTIRWTPSSLKHWEIFRQKTPSTNICFQEKKKKVSKYLSLTHAYFPFQLDQNSLSHRLLFQTHHKVSNPALFVQL